MIQDDKLTVAELAKRLKTKFPQYQLMDDQELVDKVISKYPEYKDVLKKKDLSDQDLDGGDGTSELGDGGLDSSEAEAPAYFVNEIPITKQTLEGKLNDEEFINGAIDGEFDVQIQNDQDLANKFKIAVDNAKASRVQVESEDRNIDGEVENKTDLLNPRKSVEQESLVPITKKNKYLNINPTLTHNLVNPAVNVGLEELGTVWKNHSRLNIESAFRDEELNEKVGGHDHSYHLHGMAIDLTGPSAKEFLMWATTTPEGKKWAAKYTEGADGGSGIILEDEGGPGEHVHIQFKRGLATSGMGNVDNDAFAEHPHLNPDNKPTPVSLQDMEGEQGNGFDMTDFLHKSHVEKEDKIPVLTVQDVDGLLSEDELDAVNFFIKGSEDWKGNPWKYILMNKEARESGEWWKTRLGDASHPDMPESMYHAYHSAMIKLENHINNFLSSGYEYLGDQKYKHTATGIILSPDMIGGANPLLASNSALPKLIQRIQEYPDFLIDSDNDGIADNFNGEMIHEIYEEFKGSMSGFLKGEIDSLEGDEKSLKQTEYDLKAGDFVSNLFNALSTSMESSFNNSDTNTAIKEIGTKITIAEQWLADQMALIEEYPTYAHGGLDTRNMSQNDVNRYNDLVNKFNLFRENTYLNLLAERDKIHADNPNIGLLNQMINGYNSTLNYLSSASDDPLFKKKQQKLINRRNKAQKDWNESTWVGSALRSFVTPISQTFGKFVASVGSAPQQFKSIFNYENEYDWTDKLSQQATDIILTHMEESGNSWFYRPTSLTNAESMGNVFYTNIGDDTIIFDKNNKIKNVVTKDNYVINPNSDRYRDIIKEYTENKENYPIQKKKEWGSFYYNLAQATTDFILDMTIAKKVGGGTRRLTKSARGGKLGFYGGLMGATNIRMYNMYYKEGMEQGMLPGEAAQFANQAALASSVIEVITPDFGMLNPGVKRMTTNAAIDGIFDRVSKEVVDKQVKKNIVSSVFNKQALKYGVIEGFEEVAQGYSVDLIKDNWWNRYEFDTKFDVNEALEEFTIGALIGYGATVTTDFQSSFNRDYIKGGIYKDGMYHAYTNQEETFKAIDNMVGKTVMIGGKEIEFTTTEAKKMKEGLKTKFKAMEDLIGDRSLDDLSKRELLNLIEYKQNAESLQGSQNADVLEEVKRRISESDKAIGRILKNEDPIKVMADLANNMDFEVREYIGNFMDITRLGIGTKALIRRIVKGDALTETQKTNTLEAVKQAINKLDSKNDLTSEEKSELALLKKIEKDVTNIKTKKDEKTITRGRGKARGTARGAKGKGIRKDIEEADTEQDRTTLNQNLGKKVSYKGKEGILTKDKNGNFVLKTPGKGRGIKIKDATGRKRLSTVGLKYKGKKVSVSPDGSLNIDGDNAGGILGLYKDETGGLGGVVTLDNQYSDDVKKKAVAKFKKLQKLRNDGKISLNQFQNEVKKIKGLSLESSSDVKFGAAAGKITNDILNTGKADVISLKDIEKMIKEAISELGYETEQKNETKKEKKKVDKKKKSKRDVKHQKTVVTPLFDSTKDNIDDLITKYSKYEGEVYENKVKILKIVKKLFNGIGFNTTIHKDEASLREFFASHGVNLGYVGAAMINANATIDGAIPEIHINLDKANPNTPFHEFAHPFITSLMELAKTNPEVKEALEKIKTELESIKGGKYMEFAKYGYALDKNGVPLRDRQAKDSDINNPDKVLEEALAEFLADAALDKFDTEPSILDKAKSYYNSIIKYLFGVDTNVPPMDLTLNDLSEVANLDDITKIFTEATVRGANLNQKKNGIHPQEFNHQVAPSEESSEFKEWFGNSKAVDKKGKPKKYFHITRNKFDTFRSHHTEAGRIKATTYVSPNSAWTNEFMRLIVNADKVAWEVDKESHEGVRTLELYVKAENPFDFRNKEHTDMLFDAYTEQYAGDYEHEGKKYVSQDRIIINPTGNVKVDKQTFFDNLQSKNNWAVIEAHQQLIQILGFDSMFVTETNTWAGGAGVGLSEVNLAVFNPQQQLKSVDRTSDFSSPKYQYDINEQVDAHHAGDPNNLTEETGSTFNNLFGNASGKPFVSVSIFPDLSKKIKGKKISKKIVEDYIKKNTYVLQQHESLAVGTWFNPKEKLTYIDVASVIPKEKMEEAKKLGREYNQISIFDLETFEYEETGGTGKKLDFDKTNLQDRIDKIKDIVGDIDFKHQTAIPLEGAEFNTLERSIKFSDIFHGTPKQWIKELEKYGGANISQEIKFMGIKDFLNSVERAYPDGIPKVALEDYINMHQTSLNFTNNTMSIVLGNETLGDIDYEVVSNEVGERVLFIKNIKAPKNRMMSNIAPVIRHLISFASTENYSGIAFESGDAFKGPKAEFFNSVVPEVINDIMQSIDQNAGPVLSEVGGQAKPTIEITNSVTSIVEDMLNPSKDTEHQDGFNNDSKVFYSTEFKNQFSNPWLQGTADFLTDFSFRREFLPMGNIPKEVFDMEWRYKSKVKAEKFRLMKLIDRMRGAIEENQKGDNPIPLRSINDILSDPTVKIQELESEIRNYEKDLETLDRDGKTYAAGVVIEKIRETEEDIKRLKEKHVGRATMKDLDSDPNLQNLVKQVRRKVDSLSRKLKGVVNEKLGITLDKNMGIYINRQYRIHNDESYKKRMLGVINKLIKAKADPKKIEKVIKRYKKEVDLIQGASEVIREKLTEIYKRKYKNKKEITEEQILLDIKRMFTDGPESSNFIKAVNRANDINTGIFKERLDLPDAISNLFAEAQNPLFNIITTLTKQISELETMEFKANAVAALEGSLLYREDNLPAELSDSHRYPVNIKFSDAVYYTTKEVKEFIDGEVYNPTGAYKLAQVINGAIKLGKTVYSLKTHVRNFMGNMYFASINGHFSYSDMKESFKVMQNLFDASTTQEREQMFATMIENGIIDSVYADELQDIMRDGDLGVAMTELFDAGMDMDKVKKKKPNLVKKINTLINKAYLWEDVIWKGAGFISEVNLYQKAGYERTEAIKKAADSVRGGYTTYSLVPKIGKRLRRMILVGDFVSFPAEVLRTGIMSLNVARKQLMSGNPILFKAGMKRLFGTVFAWSTLPHLYTGIAAAFTSAIGLAKDWLDDEDEGLSDNPLMDHKLMNGEERDIDSEFTLYDSYSDWFEANHADTYFDELDMDDISRDKMIQLFLPHFMKYGDVKLVSAQQDDEGYFDGTYYLWNSSDNMSNNVITRVINAIINTPEDDPTFRERNIPGVMDDVLHALLEPFLGKSMMLQLMIELGNQETETGKKFNKNTDDLGDIIKNNFNHIQREIRPSVVDQVKDMLESWHPEHFLDEDELHKKKSPVHETIALTGFRFSRFNLQENLNFKARDVANEMKTINPEDENPNKIRREVKRQMEYLDKLYTYSEALGIEEDHVVILDRDNNPVLTNLDNRDYIIGQHIQGFAPGSVIYEFVNRDRRVYKDFDAWLKAQKDVSFVDFLKPWQQEAVEQELIN